MAHVQQQPVATQGMVVTGGNRNAKNLPVDREGREWSNGLFDCCNDAGTCVLSWFCPCVVYSRNRRRLEHLEGKGTPDPEQGGCFSGACWVHCCAGWTLQIESRAKVRSRYGIKGDSWSDCCAIFWCAPCALTQESQEIKLEEQSFGGHQKA
ncbi:hypothetical protein D9615_004825 [Tricholomella constricta]|uniref:PLAC8-domain-containing protein n=1 Tax=Tricholomella constricta TaxID=117010 RepID=A0A8H5HGZ4_9AGAR|nr:hypothetical protein D9615_004825 [Tricholomella constricta]